MFSIYLSGGFIVCVVTGPRQYSADLLQGGLEVLCCYTFKINRDAKGEKARKIIEGLLSVEIIPTLQPDAESKIEGVLNQVPGVTPPDPDVDQSAVTRADREMPKSNESPNFYSWKFNPYEATYSNFKATYICYTSRVIGIGIFGMYGEMR